MVLLSQPPTRNLRNFPVGGAGRYRLNGISLTAAVAIACPGAGGVGYHQDSAYISDQFEPRDENSVTVWIALDDADQEKRRLLPYLLRYRER